MTYRERQSLQKYLVHTLVTTLSSGNAHRISKIGPRKRLDAFVGLWETKRETALYGAVLCVWWGESGTA